jgi:hypothetical protein
MILLQRGAANVTQRFTTYYWQLRALFFAESIVRKISPTLRRDAQRKYGQRMPADGEGDSYLQSRAAQLAQPLVDDIVRQNPRFPSVIGNRLLMRAARRAAAAVARSIRRGASSSGAQR